MAFRLMGMRAWPTPLLKMFHPFVLGGAVTFYLISNVSKGLSESEMFRNHPDNPKLRHHKVAH